MRHRSVFRLVVLLGIASLSACNCQQRPAVETPIAELQSCPQDERCETGLCDSVQGGEKICLRPCLMGCRNTDICTRLPDDRYACVPERAGLCRSCTQDSDCPQPADRCITLGGASFCGRDCSFDETCPSSFRCGEATTVTGERVEHQCQPSSGTCDCIAATSGQQKPCDVSNNFGTCTGVSVCRPPEGYSSCSARTPAAEACNNLDDDCNGQVDEGLGDVSCGVGECERAAAACANGAPQRCTPGDPQAERCNGRDDDCDGVTDDGFDLQTNPQHCGACNAECVLTNAVAGCAAGACTITRCVAGWTDLDRTVSNGCEYPCTPSDAGVEVCDGQDNDCNGLVDDGFDLTSDPTNCGQCNLVCSLPVSTVASYACVARACGIGQCAGGRGNCNQLYSDGCEVDLTGDVAHCGTCGNTCVTPNATPACVTGMCAIGQCGPGYADCNAQVADGCEVNTQTSLTNCGTCGTTCTAANATSSCTAGTCSFACQANYWDADGQAGNGCEYACIRTGGGVEACDSIDNDCDARVDEDFDLTSNAQHCGQCNRACSAPFATTACSASSCGITSCDPARANCNGVYVDGCEVNTASDLAHCGGCGQLCAPANAAARCTAGDCGIQSCNAGFANCNGGVADGCEVNTGNSIAHCGGCNQACAPARANPVCVAGSCGIGSCQAGWVNLNGQVSDGCEYPCSQTNGGTEACDGLDNDCDGTTDEGFVLATDVSNCGACGNACSAANVTVPRCAAGACGVQQCATGFRDCDGAFNNGCEVNVTTSLTSCGGCGIACNVPDAVNACSNGTCTFSCPAGRWNVDGNPVNGCEYACTPSNGGAESCDGQDNDCDGAVDEGFTLATDVNNCGACGNACSAQNVTVPRCTAGACGVQQCANGFANCDNTFATGCEVNLTNSINNCGGCGVTCNVPNAVNACTNGSCTFVCPANRWNVDGDASNGCEYACTRSNGGVESCDTLDNDCDGAIDEGFTLSSDVNNCGTCGNACAAANVTVPSCSSGSCGVQQCANGFANCNGGFADGCEVNVNTSVGNCGGCGVACDVPNATPVCSGGSCLVGTCTGSYRNCNNLQGDGCEADLSSSLTNCGGCGVTCNTPNAVNACNNGACAFTCPANQWDLDGNPANGCEYACTFLSATDVPDLGLVDANCDGMDGELNNSIYVASSGAGGNDANPGTRALPKATINGGLTAARTSGKRDVLVAGGTYLEQVYINEANKGVYGGYTAGAWTRSLSTAVTVTGVNTPLRIENANGAAVQAINFVGAAPVGASATAYGGLITNSSMVRLEQVNITAANGTGGTSGAPGVNGAAGGVGGQGRPGCEDSGIGCASCTRPAGGLAGTSSCGRTGGVGGLPGNGDAQGSNGQPGVTSAGGLGTPEHRGDWITPSTYWGANGAPGSDGGNGAHAPSFGLITIGGYTVAVAVSGSSGTHGNGGGGGGGGGGGDDGCNSYGGSGGGGGGGGCLATGGGRGTSGGGSFGLVLWGSTVQALNVNVTSGFGGNGGNGASGGTGGNGGTGGAQNAYGGGGEQDDASNGGRGGDGGRGGHGGHGGAGAGGPSIGVARANGAAWNAIGGSITVGAPGGGGSSPLGLAPTGATASVY